jgi:glycosyltransferase involved in cell wall biosynthesis
MRGPIAHLNLAKGYRGGERQTELLARGLAERGCSQRLIARTHAPLAERCANVPGLELDAVGGLIGAVRASARGGAIVHAHEGRGPLVAWAARLVSGMPYVITRRVTAPLKRNPVTRRFYRGAARVVAISRAIADALARYDPSLRVEVIPSALARLEARPEAVERLRARYGAGFLVVLVGALVERHKGQHVLIEVARRTARTHPDIHFALVGEGRDEATLRARGAGLGNVEITGFVEDVGSWLAAADLVVLPSLHEGLGSVLLDAMDYGRAIVATRVGGIPELVADGHNGLLVEPGSVEALERAILALHADRERLHAMGERGRARAGDYAPARMVERYVELYGRVQEEARAC